MARTLKRVLGPPLILAAAFVVVLCQVSLAQGDADLEAPGLEPFATPSSSGAHLRWKESRALSGLKCAG